MVDHYQEGQKHFFRFDPPTPHVDQEGQIFFRFDTPAPHVAQEDQFSDSFSPHLYAIQGAKILCDSLMDLLSVQFSQKNCTFPALPYDLVYLRLFLELS